MPRSAGVDLHRQAEVFVTGPFPPPVHGMAVATARLATRLGTRFDVRRFDIAARPRSGVAGLDVLLRVLASFGTLARYALGLLTRRPQAVVVAMSAGFAKIFDLFAIAIALSQRRVVYVTHHSFAVFDGRTRQGLLGACRPMLRRCRHIVLCDAMKTALCGAWQLRPDSVFVLSNAALMDSSGGPVDGARVTGGVAPASATCRLGFIANLCADKGLWTFLDVVECAQRDGCPVTALIAGPVEPPDAQLERALRNRLRRMTGVEWLGAVHGEQRAAFYEAIDLLVFPTVYLHESEPLVILEALARGVPVVTTRRGCIASALADGVAVQALEEARFVDAAAAAVMHACRNLPRDERERAVVEHYRHLCAVGEGQWQQLVTGIEQGDERRAGRYAVSPGRRER